MRVSDASFVDHVMVAVELATEEDATLDMAGAVVSGSVVNVYSEDVLTLELASADATLK